MELVVIGILFACFVILLFMLNELRNMENEIKNLSKYIHTIVFRDLLLTNKVELYE